ncbi:hypothetical protein HZH66_005845 [Vespula vulgaris]|uniref:Uncharacterized protein n=1 Tax=Vespula vulgaris TaxID=7454 RepID=A0A834K7K9_VESVU|nr:hypothetical protein HZH66_005845 [Vespula vulgaris]
MLCLKKLYREELLQLALLLSLLRVDPESYFGLDIQAMGVGSLDLHNGSGWHTDAHTIVHRPMFVHPKNLDSMLLNYERDLFEELNSLGRYNRLNSGSNDIHAYLLNIEDTGRNAAVAGSSLPVSTETARNMTSPDSPSSSQQPAEPIGAAELTQEMSHLTGPFNFRRCDFFHSKNNSLGVQSVREKDFDVFEIQ